LDNSNKRITDLMKLYINEYISEKNKKGDNNDGPKYNR